MFVCSRNRALAQPRNRVIACLCARALAQPRNRAIVRPRNRVIALQRSKIFAKQRTCATVPAQPAGMLAEVCQLLRNTYSIVAFVRPCAGQIQRSDIPSPLARPAFDRFFGTFSEPYVRFNHCAHARARVSFVDLHCSEQTSLVSVYHIKSQKKIQSFLSILHKSLRCSRMAA
jgi:hypothetical protein